MAGVLFAAATGFTMIAHAGASPQAQRTECSGPKAGGLFSEPLLDIRQRVSCRGHGACVPYSTHACQVKKMNFSQLHNELRVLRQKLDYQCRNFRSNNTREKTGRENFDPCSCLPEVSRNKGLIMFVFVGRIDAGTDRSTKLPVQLAAGVSTSGR